MSETWSVLVKSDFDDEHQLKAVQEVLREMLRVADPNVSVRFLNEWDIKEGQ